MLYYTNLLEKRAYMTIFGVFLAPQEPFKPFYGTKTIFIKIIFM